MQDSEGKNNNQEIFDNLSDSFAKERRNRRIKGIFRLIAGIVIVKFAITASLEGNAIFYGAVISF